MHSTQQTSKSALDELIDKKFEEVEAKLKDYKLAVGELRFLLEIKEMSK